jgi:DNA mismatch repair protein MutL
VLKPQVAEAIAAGEVIERPASVVKELVENSLDAGAHRITVEFQAGGAELIRVADDGDGMSAAELGLAFQRHATSKLSVIDDLAWISTFGFRGEALASIASAAQVSATSWDRRSSSGARIEVTDREVAVPVPVAAPPGTVVEVRNLFGKTPARRAFLRSTRAEASACLRVVAEAALSRPDVAFEVRVDGRRSLGAPGRGGLQEAARSVLGKAESADLLAVEWTGGGVCVAGLIGPPEVARASRSSLVLMVNGRRVHQRALVAAVEGAYRGLLPVGRYPVAVLDIRCDPSEVDVNVHPTKREVRFGDESRFFEAVQRACWGALQGLGPGQLPLPSGGRAGIGSAAGGGSARAPGPWAELAEELPLVGGPGPVAAPSEPLGAAASWRYLGQAHNRYLVVETSTGIALLDQHAAHEKVLYTRILGRLRESAPSGATPAQRLLQPALVEVGPQAVAELAAAEPLLERAGFELAAFGEGTVRCSAVPPGSRLSELPQLLAEVLAGTQEVPEGEAGKQHRVAASIACHSAVRFGDPVNPEEVARLLSDLADTPGGITCPHGRPALLLLSETHLLSAFARR